MTTKCLILAAFLTLLIASAACCAPQVWLSDSFDAHTTGALAGQGGWEGAQGPVSVQTSFVKSGKAIWANRQVTGTGDVYRTVSSGGGYHYVDFDAAMDMSGTGGSGTNVGYMRFLGPSGSEITRVYFAYRQFKVLTGPANQTLIQDNVVNRQWYHIRMGIDLSNGALDVWVDGVQKVTAAPTYQAASSIDKVIIGQWPPEGVVTQSAMYIDNLHCVDSNSIPPSLILAPKYFPGWQAHNVCYPFVLVDNATGLYRMYYSGSGTCYINDSLWDQWCTGVVTSLNTLDWKYPDSYEQVLMGRTFMQGDIVDLDDCSAIFDSIAAIGPCVVQEGGAYRMWYTGWNGDTVDLGGGLVDKVNYRIGCATSPDGDNWTRYPGAADAGAVFGLGQPGELDSKGVAHPHVIKENGTYRMWYEGYDGTAWRIFYATSADGIEWTRNGLALGLGASGAPDALGVRNPVVIYRNGRYELWYQGRGAVAPNYHVMRATSPDGINWTKVYGQVNLRPSDTLDSDEAILVDSIIVRTDGSCQVFYAKQHTVVAAAAYGAIKSRYYYIHTEVVNP